MGRILVVDDEVNLLVTLVANLELEGFEVIGAASPHEALELVEREPFDLVSGSGGSIGHSSSGRTASALPLAPPT